MEIRSNIDAAVKNGAEMPQNPVKRWNDLAAAVADERDSKKINDLIEQLDRDLTETQKNAPGRH